MKAEQPNKARKEWVAEFVLWRRWASGL